MIGARLLIFGMRDGLVGSDIRSRIDALVCGYRTRVSAVPAVMHDCQIGFA
jgi:hypothetical protein